MIGTGDNKGESYVAQLKFYLVSEDAARVQPWLDSIPPFRFRAFDYTSARSITPRICGDRDWSKIIFVLARSNIVATVDNNFAAKL